MDAPLRTRTLGRGCNVSAFSRLLVDRTLALHRVFQRNGEPGKGASTRLLLGLYRGRLRHFRRQDRKDSAAQWRHFATERAGFAGLRLSVAFPTRCERLSEDSRRHPVATEVERPAHA